MLVHIPSVLSKAQISQLHSELNQAAFIDGKLTAGPTASKLKTNEELPQASDLVRRLGAVVNQALHENWVFKNAIMPISNTEPIFARYTQGMAYGQHLDASLSAGLSVDGNPLAIPGRCRSDMSCTVFLNDPEEYIGGELILHTPIGVASVKYAAGDAVLYPSTYVHEVSEVTSGVRLVSVAWYQCAVRDVEKRSMLYDLIVASSGLMDRHPDDAATLKVNQVLQNLLRRWGDTH